MLERDRLAPRLDRSRGYGTTNYTLVLGPALRRTRPRAARCGARVLGAVGHLRREARVLGAAGYLRREARVLGAAGYLR